MQVSEVLYRKAVRVAMTFSVQELLSIFFL